MQRLKNKVVVITGASRGIGRGIATLFAREQTRLVLCARSKTALEDTARSLDIDPDNCKIVVADIRRSDEMKRLIDTAYITFNQVDIFVNNAGVGVNKNLLDTSVTEFDLIFDTNIRAVFCCLKALIPRMRAHGSGQIINVSSMAGKAGRAGRSVYAASKAALNIFSEAVANEVRNYNIKVSLVSPSATNTQLMSEMDATASSRSKAVKWLTVEEVAEAVLFLAKQNENVWVSLAEIQPLLVRR
ncbi:MAG: SDR family oxidoreductase [candidate division Zixibacteria bacterium]|nr:SDR family oxidoreductase [candidate division Zixibacteria bacterium]